MSGEELRTVSVCVECDSSEVTRGRSPAMSAKRTDHDKAPLYHCNKCGKAVDITTRVSKVGGDPRTGLSRKLAEMDADDI